jgi:hypothetical protein
MPHRPDLVPKFCYHTDQAIKEILEIFDFCWIFSELTQMDNSNNAE